jgi:hypothetical protein
MEGTSGQGRPTLFKDDAMSEPQVPRVLVAGAAEQELEPKVVGRVVISPSYVTVCGKRFERSLLSTWRGWDGITSLAMHQEPRLTQEELDALGEIATGGGKNGYAELLSAIKNRA